MSTVRTYILRTCGGVLPILVTLTRTRARVTLFAARGTTLQVAARGVVVEAGV